MKLSAARYIHKNGQENPLLWIGPVTSDKFGSQADMKVCGDNLGYYLMGNAEGTEWHVAHFVYGGSYAQGATPKEALMNFASKIKWLPEEKKKRKIAAKIVEKYGIGPVIEKEGNTWVARIDGKVVAKAEQPVAARKMAERYEAQLRKEAQ